MAGGRITNLFAENFTLTTTILNLAMISTPTAGTAGAATRIKRVEISQNGTTTLQMIRGAFSTQTGTTVTATSTTPAKLNPVGVGSLFAGNGSPFGGTLRSATNASVNTTPSYTNQHVFNFANLNGYLWQPTPEEEIVLAPSQFWSVRLLADPTTLTGWCVSVILEEM